MTANLEQRALKPCPFCGAVRGARTGGPKVMVSDSGKGWTVRCTGCLVRGQQVFGRAEAIAAWNTRPESALKGQPASSGWEGIAPERLIELLGQAIDKLNPLTGQSEDNIWRPADKARSLIIEVRDALAAQRVSIPDAMKALQAHMADDPMFAWGWHCNLAMPIMDATGVSHKLANEAAAHLMQHLFDYDITTHEYYEGGKSGAQQYVEMRIAAEREEDSASLPSPPEPAAPELGHE